MSPLKDLSIATHGHVLRHPAAFLIPGRNIVCVSVKYMTTKRHLIAKKNKDNKVKVSTTTAHKS